MEDYLIRIISKEAGVRAIACLTTGLVNELCARHGTSPTAAASFGRVLTGGALMGALLKVQHRIAIKFEGNGPLQKMVVESDSYGHVRGYPSQPTADVRDRDGKVDIIAGLGELGLLTVVKDMRVKSLTEGVVPLAVGNISQDLTYYLEQSEQIPSLVDVGALPQSDGLVAVAGGLLIQSMPPDGREAVELIKDRLLEMPPMEQLLHSGQTPEEILAQLFVGIEYETLEKRNLEFRCSCSLERSEKALLALGYEGIKSLMEEEGEALIECHFCHEKYLFEREDLEILLIEIELDEEA